MNSVSNKILFLKAFEHNFSENKDSQLILLATPSFDLKRKSVIIPKTELTCDKQIENMNDHPLF